MKAILIFSVFLFLAPLTIDAGWDDDSFEDDDCCVCPNITIEPAEYDSFLEEVTLKVYDTPIDGADEFTEEAMDALRCLIESEQSYHRVASYVIAGWLSSFIGNLDHLPPFCGIAQIINASVSDSDPDQLRCALDAVTNLIDIYRLYRQQNGIDASGCEAPSVIDNLEFPTCSEDGFAYNIDILWKRRGHILPGKFRGIARRLYKSDLVANKLIAILLSYTITEQIQYMLNRVIAVNSVEAVSLQYSCEIPECCCPERLALLKTLSDYAIEKVSQAFDEIKPPGTCPCPTVGDY